MVESGFDDRPDVTAGLAAHQFFRGICTGALCMQHQRCWWKAQDAPVASSFATNEMCNTVIHERAPRHEIVLYFQGVIVLNRTRRGARNAPVLRIA